MGQRWSLSASAWPRRRKTKVKRMSSRRAEKTPKSKKQTRVERTSSRRAEKTPKSNEHEEKSHQKLRGRKEDLEGASVGGEVSSEASVEGKKTTTGLPLGS